MIFGLVLPRKKIECPICHGLGTMVNDHDHAIQFNNFRGIAHAHCNLQYQKNSFAIPIWAHNGMKYDFHFIFRTIGENIKEYKEEETIIIKKLRKEQKLRKVCFPDLKPIAKSEMNFVSVRWGDFIFLDTMNFFKGKLEELWHVVANHEEKKDSKGHSYWDETNENLDVFETTNEIIPILYPNIDPKKAMKGKGRIPYAWLTKERMKHKHFPTDLDSWFDDLYGEEAKREDVDRYLADFDAFQCQSVEEGCDIYLTKDNCILMDVVSHFNKFTMKQFHLDIGKFVSLPNLSWLAWLLSLDPSKEIETVKTIDQYNICE